MERENFSSRLGFILISAGCAIGLGNVWRFPYIVGEYGGAIFLIIYFLFLLIFGLPIMTMEFAVGRASGKSVAASFRSLEKQGTKWHLASILGVLGNYLLMMFYTTVTGWMLAYFFKSLRGDFINATTEQISTQFASLTSNPATMFIFMAISVILGFWICSLGLKNGVEKITKFMMLALLGIIVILAVQAVTLDGAAEGVKYYLVPDFSRIMKHSWGEIIFAALGQAFFTLSIGVGSMAIFGSYIKKERRLFGEAVSVALLDTFVAFASGLIIIPSCFAYGINPGAGPGLIFETLPNVFANMSGGHLWGSLFFLFLLFAALSTVVAVFENIMAFGMDLWGWSRKKSCLINTFIMIILSLPACLGFNLLSFIEPLGSGSTLLDLEDFIVSNNLLPLGSLAYVLFCTSKSGWGWDNFMLEANNGRGLKFPTKIRFYARYILPVIIVLIWVQGYISKFWPNLISDILAIFH